MPAFCIGAPGFVFQLCFHIWLPLMCLLEVTGSVSSGWVPATDVGDPGGFTNFWHCPGPIQVIISISVSDPGHWSHFLCFSNKINVVNVSN